MLQFITGVTHTPTAMVFPVIQLCCTIAFVLPALHTFVNNLYSIYIWLGKNVGYFIFTINKDITLLYIK